MHLTFLFFEVPKSRLQAQEKEWRRLLRKRTMPANDELDVAACNQGWTFSLSSLPSTDCVRIPSCMPTILGKTDWGKSAASAFSCSSTAVSTVSCLRWDCERDSRLGLNVRRLFKSPFKHAARCPKATACPAGVSTQDAVAWYKHRS